jgi:hypothetical protein
MRKLESGREENVRIERFVLRRTGCARAASEVETPVCPSTPALQAYAQGERFSI